ncbi:aminotransferase class V-fold PLP-dependent enzyme [Wenxinia marina]|uniref:Selenocysteine lyase n=1 Tax=Wenxinia marina DSM 24838 TaxID=1123501 RepID=A0A0D0PED9_9RHOB|nr:aminotransferase class V-fold PLP-dependent enzyme [Wenxinia marina]KIQ69761.1 Selenocysteine lyase [Wenxinia marina DSM 24838]GGL60934.1 cysteine desulfurase-like protein [Wenxinia marina]
MFSDALLTDIRSRFAHVEACPFSGPRIFFESAGGALHLNAVAETSARFAAIPDNQGRDNPASAALMQVIAKGKDDARMFLNAPGGEIFFGESGTEVLYRLVRTAAVGAAEGGVMLGTTLEHPASREAMAHWAKVTGRPHVMVPHDDATGTVTADAWRTHLTPEVRVASVIHTSPVTGQSVDLAAICATIREVAPEALIIVDGIQHASHGAVDLSEARPDGYAVSPYKVFSRHGYGIGWASDRLSALPREGIGGKWEHGTRDTGSYATWSDVVAYLDWLGGTVSDAGEPRARLEAAAEAIGAHERGLAQALIEGSGNLAGLRDLPGVTLVGGEDVSRREGVVSFDVAGRPAGEIVRALADEGIRVHSRNADVYSGNVLTPLGLADCVRVSFGHYNSLAEVRSLLAAMARIIGA